MGTRDALVRRSSDPLFVLLAAPGDDGCVKVSRDMRLHNWAWGSDNRRIEDLPMETI